MRTMKKMASLLSVCVFLLCCSAAVASRGCDQLVAVGGDVDVPLGYELKPTDALRWNFNGNIIFSKKRGRMIEGKNDDINDDGSLKLTNLKLDQEGLYTSEVFGQDGKKTSSKSTNLCVLDPVKKPTLNITCLTSEVVFTCSHDPQPDGTKQYDTIHYKWLQNGNLISNATEISMTRKVAETENLLVSCEVGNQVSSATSDSLTHTCIGCDKYIATGRSFNVPLGYKLKSTDTLKWKFNEKVIFDKRRSLVVTGEATDITEDGSLKLTNLKKDQEGNYTPEAFNSNGKSLKTVKTHLCIKDPVKKPAVTAECKEEEKKVIFKCVTDKTPKSEIKKYQWLRNNVQMDKTDPTFMLTAAETKDIKFACNISNDVSFEISEPVTHNCGEISCDQFAAADRSFIIPLGNQLKPTDSLKWEFNGNTIFYRRSAEVVIGKTDDINEDGSLKLINVRENQMGRYNSDVFDETRKAHSTKETNLCVLDPVKKPKVNATCQDGKVKFHCFLGQQPRDAKYEWLLNGAKMEENNLTFEIKAEESKDDKFVCKVFNKASSETSEPVANNCAEIGFPDNRCGIRLWVFNGYRVVVLLLLAIAATVCCIWDKRKRKMRLKNDVELPLKQTDPEQPTSSSSSSSS